AQTPNAAIADFRSDTYARRAAGFYKILTIANKDQQPTGSLRPRAQALADYARKNPSVATALIALLERENRPDPSKENLSEDTYYGDLIGCVAALKGPRAVNALLGAINTGGM